MKVTQISEIHVMDYCKSSMQFAAAMLLGGMTIISITVSDNPQDYSSNPDVKLRATFLLSIAKELEASRKEHMNTKPSFQ